MPLKPGDILRLRYRIENVLGQGGMGAVYRAYDINLAVAVAVKENLFITEEYARQFRREATILASLRHPNLPRVTDHFVVEGQGQYLVMDFVEGEDLRERLERTGPVPEREALPWFLEICDALAYLHSRTQPIVHRDIKPGNIKTSPDGRAILVDFGLAKVSEVGGITTTGAKAMTPGFSPPEQYGTGRTDSRTDVYSLAATLYAALTASIPEDALERAMGREVLTSPRKKNPSVGPNVSRAIEKAMEIRPDERYQSVAEFAAALTAASDAARATLVHTFPYLSKTMAASETTLPPALRAGAVELGGPRKRWPAVALTLATLAFLAISATVALPGLSPRIAAFLSGATATLTGTAIHGTPTPATSANTAETAATSSATATARPVSLFTRTAPPSEAGPSATPSPPPATPTGGGVGQIAFASDRTGVPQIYLINVDGTGLVQLSNLPDGACQPAWSPDGQRLIFTSPCRRSQEFYAGSSLWLMSLAELEPKQFETVPGGGDFDPAWDPNGDRVAFTSLRDIRPQIYIMNLDGSGLKNLSDNFARERQPAWDPRGTQLLFTSNRSNILEVWFMPDFGGEAQRFSISGGRDESNADWSMDGQLIVLVRRMGGIPRLVALRFEDRNRVASQVCPEGPYAAQPMTEPSWSPDARWIALETWPTGIDHNIAILTSSCTNYALLTTDPGADFDPAWRP
ncbi:MAG TPA: protein kinase [Anaerolineales bacterium]|nr:protein kinase [Anaerolineales bacterium]